MKIGIVDYGVGNLGSVVSAIESLRVTAAMVTAPVQLNNIDCIVLPGVGSFDVCANRLQADGWTDAIRDQVLGHDKPILGICLGMQLLAGTSEEITSGVLADRGPGGLDLIGGDVRHIRNLDCRLRVPHVGWNAVVRTVADVALLDGIPDETDFYFVHSYGVVVDEDVHCRATTHYDVPIAAVIGKGRIWGTQFHPEKSSAAGLQVLRNFLDGAAC